MTCGFARLGGCRPALSGMRMVPVVAYVRTVRTASGARAVQIVYSQHRGSRVIEHVGSVSHPGSDGGPDTRMIFLVEGRTFNGCSEEVPAGVAGSGDPAGEGVGPAVGPYRQGPGRAPGGVAQLDASGRGRPW